MNRLGEPKHTNLNCQLQSSSYSPTLSKKEIVEATSWVESSRRRQTPFVFVLTPFVETQNWIRCRCVHDNDYITCTLKRCACKSNDRMRMVLIQTQHNTRPSNEGAISGGQIVGNLVREVLIFTTFPQGGNISIHWHEGAVYVHANGSGQGQLCTKRTKFVDDLR